MSTFLRADGWHKQWLWEWLMASWLCCGERRWTKSVLGPESAFFWICLGSSLKGKCVLTKQSQFIDAVKSVIHKKFLNGPTNWKISVGSNQNGWKLLYLFHSQNHSMIEVGRHLWRLPSPAYLLKQAQLEQVAQGCVLSGFKYLHRWRLYNFSGQLVFPVAALQPWFFWFHDLPRDKTCPKGHVQELADRHWKIMKAIPVQDHCAEVLGCLFSQT